MGEIKKWGIERRAEGYGRSLLEFQAVVLASFLVVGSAIILSDPQAVDPVLAAFGVAVLVLVTAAIVLWRHNTRVHRFSLLVPLIDIVGIRLVMLADGSLLSGGALLLILPTVWIAYSFGPRGFATCVALLVVTSPPSFLEAYSSFTPGEFTRLVAFPLTVVVMAAAAGVAGVRMRRKRAELAAQTALTEQAVRARDELIEAVTHELRTPLTSILGNAEVLLRHSHEPNQVERRAGVILRNAEQADAILADLLLARSTDTSRLRLRRVNTELRGLVENSVAACRAAAEARQISIDLALPRQVWALADPNRIGQVLDNLLTNAVKYNQAGGTVRVSEAHDAGTVTLSVTDTGVGIAPAEHGRVFEPYYRTESARSSAEAGSGLGLGISREIARSHGGDLRLARSTAAGSSFVLTLPLAAQPAAELPATVSQGAA